MATDPSTTDTDTEKESVDLPSPADESDLAPVTVGVTQYGIRFPDGTEHWGTLTLDITSEELTVRDGSHNIASGTALDSVELQKLSANRDAWDARAFPEQAEALHTALHKIAASVLMDVADYAERVQIISRHLKVSMDRGIRDCITATEFLE